jgi:hypothetical protein
MEIKETQITVKMNLEEIKTLLYICGNLSDHFMFQQLGMQEENVNIVRNFYSTFNSIMELDDA